MLVAEVCEVNKPEEQKIETRMDLMTAIEEAWTIDVGATLNPDMAVEEPEDLLVVLVKAYTVMNFAEDNE